MVKGTDPTCSGRGLPNVGEFSALLQQCSRSLSQPLPKVPLWAEHCEMPKDKSRTLDVI